MGKTKPFRIEAAGWGFWLIATLLLVGPCVYGAFQLTQSHLSRDIPIGIGVIAAALIGAVVTLAANTVIQQAHARRKAAERRQDARKTKK